MGSHMGNRGMRPKVVRFARDRWSARQTQLIEDMRNAPETGEMATPETMACETTAGDEGRDTSDGVCSTEMKKPEPAVERPAQRKL